MRSSAGAAGAVGCQARTNGSEYLAPSRTCGPRSPADALVISTPEYAGALPGALKNRLEWTVGDGGAYGEPVAWLNVAGPAAPPAPPTRTRRSPRSSATSAPTSSPPPGPVSPSCAPTSARTDSSATVAFATRSAPRRRPRGARRRPGPGVAAGRATERPHRGRAVDQRTAAEFAAEWERNWNAHDLDALLAHFAEDVVFTSPVAAQLLPDGDGVIRGREALRAYWSYALGLLPDLHFTVEDVYSGLTRSPSPTATTPATASASCCASTARSSWPPRHLPVRRRRGGQRAAARRGRPSDVRHHGHTIRARRRSRADCRAQQPPSDCNSPLPREIAELGVERAGTLRGVLPA